MLLRFIFLFKSLVQGSTNSVLEFSSNPDQTHLPVSFLLILKTLISLLRCVFDQGWS